MSYLRKQQYQYRQESATNRMEENARIDTLTEEQHEALATICAMRHELHSANINDLYNTESGNFDKLTEYMTNFTGEEQNFSKIAENAKLPSLNITYGDDLPTDADPEPIEYEDARREITSYIEKVNTEVEHYLAKIDIEYGTFYCPIGFLRV